MFLIPGVEIGEVPQTPATPLTAKLTPKADRALLLHALRLGYPVGYAQEQDGLVIQNIVPVHKLETQQISSSSKVELEMHTETAFHPHMPHWVLLLCMRGDSKAETTYAIKDEILEKLDDSVISVLKTDSFYTTIDDSFRTKNEPNAFIRKQILSDDEQKFIYDSSAMKPLSEDAERALALLGEAVIKSQRSIVLQTGDLMIIDNYTMVHGRKPFQARYDGTDRWLKRCLVVDHLPMQDMSGGVIDTRLEPYGMSELELSDASIAQWIEQQTSNL